LWVDAREGAALAQGGVPGAVVLHEGDWDALFPAFLAAWEPGVPVLVFCSNDLCPSARRVRHKLAEEFGVTDVFVVAGGWEAAATP
jgi:hypothetical protein